jgi:hypothetical protein
MSDKDDNFWEDIKKIQQAFKEIDAEYAKMADECDPELKLAVTKWVMKHIVEHAKEGGSYRYLIYDRLGFGPEAYAPLCSDGLTISNEFSLDTVPDARRMLEMAFKHEDNRDYYFRELKEILNCCDEPGCYEVTSAGWPTEDGGYRHTCGDHYRLYNKEK